LQPLHIRVSLLPCWLNVVQSLQKTPCNNTRTAARGHDITARSHKIRPHLQCGALCAAAASLLYPPHTFCSGAGGALSRNRLHRGGSKVGRCPLATSLTRPSRGCRLPNRRPRPAAAALALPQRCLGPAHSGWSRRMLPRLAASPSAGGCPCAAPPPWPAAPTTR
jgi:hypothetical protein